MRLSDTNNEIVRYTLTASLLYGAYLTFCCPCDEFLSCHKKHFYVALGFPLATCIYLNELNG